MSRKKEGEPLPSTEAELIQMQEEDSRLRDIASKMWESDFYDRLRFHRAQTEAEGKETVWTSLWPALLEASA